MKTIEVTAASANVSVEPNYWMFFGVVVGVVLGLLLCVFLFWWFRGRWGFASRYDERQKIQRGKCYRNAFWTVILYLCVWWLMWFCDFPLLSAGYMALIGIFVGLIVCEISAIITGAWMGIDDNPKKLIITLAVLDVVNLALFFPGCWMGDAMCWVNLTVAVLGLAGIIAYGIRRAIVREEED